jgi:acyl-CoA synthetase (AMP-forming)/AMP-acid ligase II
MTDAPGPTFAHVTVASGVRSAALRTPDKTAVVEGDRSVTFTRLRERMDRLSSLLTDELGLTPGDRAAVLSPNCLEYVEVVLALAQSGVAAVHVGTKAAPEEIEFICADAGVRVLFVHESVTALLTGLELSGVQRVVVLQDADYERWLAGGTPVVPTAQVREWDTYCVFYTSGTTGRPKAVLVPHRSRVLNFLCMASEYGCFGPDDHALAIAPMSHGAGLTFSIAPIFFGGTTTLHRSFDPAEVVAELCRGVVTNLFVVPTHVQRIFALTRDQLGERPKALRRIISNAAPLSHPLKEKVVEHFGPDVLFECYGSTEAGIVSNLAPADQLSKPGSVGKAFPLTEVRILDEHGHEVLDGEVGELWSSGPALFNGYIGVPLDQIPGLRDGWFCAGDLARRDAQGYLYIVGRRHDLIITGGLNVYPREVEDALRQHPAVEDAAIFASADERWGEAVHAAVTLHTGHTVTAEDLQQHCRERLARYKVPKAVTVLDELPRTATGKVLRSRLPELTGDRSVT